MSDELIRAPIPYKLDRWFERELLRSHSERVIGKIEREVGSRAKPVEGATAAGDPSRLRGLPAIGRGVGGAINGTDPERELLKSEWRAADSAARTGS